MVMTALSSRFMRRLKEDKNDDTVLQEERTSVWLSLAPPFAHSRSTPSARAAIRRANTTWTRLPSTRGENSNRPRSHSKKSKPISKLRIIPVKSRGKLELDYEH